jgi:hypothetical protein
MKHMLTRDCHRFRDQHHRAHRHPAGTSRADENLARNDQTVMPGTLARRCRDTILETHQQSLGGVAGVTIRIPPLAKQNQKEKAPIMSTVSVSSTRSAAFEGRTGSCAGVVRRIFDAIIESRVREAQRRTTAHLLAMGDQRLRDLGFSTSDIQALSSGESVGTVLARRASQRR